MVNAEDQFPYDRPPLSKEYLAGKMKSRELFFRADSYFARNKVEVFRGRRAQSIDVSRRTVVLDDGRELSYGSLLLATGGTVRKLELPGSDLAGILYLRSLQDCEAIRSAAKGSKKVAIIGGGFIGCEVAATLTRRGLKVTLIEVAPRLLSAAIDEETARWVQDYHSKKGVKILTSTKVAGYRGKDGRVNGVELERGKVIPADFVVVGVGITLNTELADNAGLKVDRGIVVDEHLKTSADGVYAAGDVARFYSPIFKRYLRLEHVDVAQKQGAVVGMNMAGTEKSFDELPYFFSNQFDLEINAFGDLSQHTRVIRNPIGER
jgi:3-phenylpropionate/trans-cinnamate dioxygenase ferredoxin reductase component